MRFRIGGLPGWQDCTPRGNRHGAVENVVRRLLGACAVALAAVTGCSASAGQPAPAASAASAAPAARDPRTAAALLKIAKVFNREYDTGDYGPVYDRWDARSRAVISRAEYIRRHRDCPSEPQPAARVESATRGQHGAWVVAYEIGGQQLTDYWYYVHGRWEFDLVLSNPDAVKLYRLSPQRYARAVGCVH